MANIDKINQEELAPPRKARFSGPFWWLWWYLEWALPGLGMFCEAYIIFSAGQISPFQQALWPSCFVTTVNCDPNYVKHLSGYLQIVGIIAGMLMWGTFGDLVGRKWGSICASSVMLSGVIMLTFTAYAQYAFAYFVFFLIAQTWYGFGVGGEYPMASASAAERSATTPELRHLRAQQVILVFSNQGMGTFTNAFVIAACMGIFGATGKAPLPEDASKKIITLQYGIGALVVLFTLSYRFIFLNESKMFEEEKAIRSSLTSTTAHGLYKHWISFQKYFFRLWVGAGCWVASDFAFYGNKLQQGIFLGILFPGSTPYKAQQWNVLNSFIALLGYYTAAALCDKPWYGRVRCQWVGFLAMFIFYIIIYGQWENMAIAPNPKLGIVGSTTAGAQAMQALYYLSSFFNQFGPNATTWLVAGEIFPTDVRGTYHGFCAAMGKVGAIISALWISYISDNRKIFLISAIWGISGAIVTFIWLPDTTGLDLEEYDRMHRMLREGKFNDYHGEAINPRHLSLWEIYVQGWHKNYNPELDREQFEAEIKQFALTNKEGTEQMKRMSLVTPDIVEIVDKASHMNA
ncbi:hypothetical protein CEUSTIGMA_g538.t1 [Chlamydomonas eustigma]|uniref:Major facilitator superfamily (MFS) profile domain-containing protein n=1 Tax=Chlamydomonas eustigma TaxID=1157962 RepID=A0A250WQF6_9CHLO|nr:hypothetical protein CEUSTIGMA_g538.t1 [Chlamydomonas eustigma]|eukprot:GAX73085.1 hypothetical protein CEUSTIGMA_g538.t1 [Chlamydomonas eustigma]